MLLAVLGRNVLDHVHLQRVLPDEAFAADVARERLLFVGQMVHAMRREEARPRDDIVANVAPGKYIFVI